MLLKFVIFAFLLLMNFSAWAEDSQSSIYKYLKGEISREDFAATEIYQELYGDDEESDHEVFIDNALLEAMLKALNLGSQDCDLGGLDIICAARIGDKEKVVELIDQGVDLDVHDREGFTPLMIAVRTRNDLEVIEVLAKAEIAQNGKLSEKILFAALENDSAENPRSEVVKKLVEWGADINQRSEYGFTPLMIAVYEGSPSTVNVLLETGAEVNAKYFINNFEPVKVQSASALYYRQMKIYEFLEAEGLNQISALEVAVKLNESDSAAKIIEILTRAGANTNGLEASLEMKKLGGLGVNASDDNLLKESL